MAGSRSFFLGCELQKPAKLQVFFFVFCFEVEVDSCFEVDRALFGATQPK